MAKRACEIVGPEDDLVTLMGKVADFIKSRPELKNVSIGFPGGTGGRSVIVSFDDPHQEPGERLTDRVKELHIHPDQIVWGLRVSDVIGVLLDDIRLDVEQALATNERRYDFDMLIKWVAEQKGIQMIGWAEQVKVELLEKLDLMHALDTLPRLPDPFNIILEPPQEGTDA